MFEINIAFAIALVPLLIVIIAAVYLLGLYHGMGDDGIEYFTLCELQMELYRKNGIKYAVSASYGYSGYQEVVPVEGKSEFDIIKEKAEAMKAARVDIRVQPHIAVQGIYVGVTIEPIAAAGKKYGVTEVLQ